MKTVSAVVIAAALCLSSATFVSAAEQEPAQKTSGKKPSIRKEQTVTETASVLAVDPATRIVTLQGAKGPFDITAGDEVRNLAQLKVGDRVKVKYHQSIAVDVRAPGSKPLERQESVVLERANLGEKPGGKIRKQITVTARVESIDTKKQSVVLKNPEGKNLDVKVANPANLENVKVGDEVVMTVTEAVAISVKGVK